MSEYLQAFLLGNAAIVGNVCMLPLYPGLFVMLAGRATAEQAGPVHSQGFAAAVAPTIIRVRSVRWLGVFVLAGVLAAMVAVGALLHLLRSPVARILPVLPTMYVRVAVLGILMIAGRNPFARMATTSIPVLRRPAASAFVYGSLMAPLTLPCTGSVARLGFPV